MTNLQHIKEIEVDFYDSKYTVVNAKRFDKSSRFLLIQCKTSEYDIILDDSEHSAYIRYRKADNMGIFSPCDITVEGKVLVELSEQMLSVSGISYADLVIVKKGQANINPETGKLNTIDNSAILSTMSFCVKVIDSALDNVELEQGYEYNKLNTVVEKFEAEYGQVIEISRDYAITSQSYAVGGTDTREDEDIDNSKYYYQENSKLHSEVTAMKEQTSDYMKEAQIKAQEASDSATAAKQSEENAAESETAAKQSEDKALSSEQIAVQAQAAATESEHKALDYAITSQSYAVGGTDTREDEDIANSQYYYTMISDMVKSLNGTFKIQQVISFADLETIAKQPGYIYIIKDDFTTDDRFEQGAGYEYGGGTNVFYTANETWDCLPWSVVSCINKQDIATVEEVKEYLNIQLND